MSSGCSDTLSLADLQTAKKHQLFEAEVITGKQGGVAGGTNIDYATNQITGQTQKTLPAVLRDAGFLPASFDFTTGGTLTIDDRNKVVYDPVSTTWYSWAGVLPKVIPAGTNPLLDANWKPQTDPNLRQELVTPESGIKVDSSNVNIKAIAPSTKDIPLSIFAQSMVSLLSFDDIIADGVTDTRAGVQAAIDACAAAGKTLYIPDGVYGFGNFFTQPSNSHIVFGENAWFKLLNATTWPGLGGIGHFHNTGTNYNDFLNPDGITIKFVEAVNVSTVGMKLDCNNIGGENGITSAWGSNIRHIRPVVKNTVHTNALLGGRAFQFEGNTNQDIVVTGATILDCSIGCNSQGLAGSSTANTRALTYDGIFMKNVGVPFNIYGQVAIPETADATVHSVAVFNAVLHNCGGPRAPFGGQLDGGIICSDRGAGLIVDGLRVVNETSYGGISAIFRGVMYNTAIYNADITATYITSVVDHTPPGFGSPSIAATGCFVSARNVKINANMDYIGKAPNNSTGKHDLELFIDNSKATIGTLFDSNIANSSSLATLAMVSIIDTSTGNSSGRRSFYDLYTNGNSPATCIRRKDAIGTITPIDASGASLTFTVNGVQRYVKHGELVTVTVNITYPATSTSQPAAIAGLPVAGLVGVNFAGVAPVLNGATGSLAVVKGGENFIRINTATGGNVINSDLSGKNIAITLQYMY